MGRQHILNLILATILQSESTLNFFLLTTAISIYIWISSLWNFEVTLQFNKHDINYTSDSLVNFNNDISTADIIQPPEGWGYDFSH
jgi:hypothetical protein